MIESSRRPGKERLAERVVQAERGRAVDHRRMQNILSRLGLKALDLLLPLSCAVCGREGRLVCEACRDALPALRKPYCVICADPGTTNVCRWCRHSPLDVDGIRVPYLFEGAVRDLIYALKYGGIRAAAPDLGGLLAEYVESLDIGSSILVPVPLHPRRERRRGYNQSELLARELGLRTGLPVAYKLVRRIRDSPPQVEMEGPGERRRNVQGSFECPSGVDEGSVLLVDDVVTTGSTLSACASALKDAGVETVRGVAVARQALRGKANEPEQAVQGVEPIWS